MKNQIEEKKELLRYYYDEKHYGQDKCAKLLGPGIGRTTVKQWLKELGLPIRDFAEARSYAISHRKEKDENYFSVESHNMAWLLGFLASDGTINSKNNHIKIDLSSVDREILEKIKNEVNIENEIKEYTTNKGYKVVSLGWTCEKHKKDLAKYNIVPRKTFILQPPLNLSKEYYIDYIRGYFDGDGCICFNSQKSIAFGICGGSKGLLEWIINVFYEIYGIPKVNIHTDKRREKPFYYFNYSTTASKKIYTILYNESNMYLKRKKEKFENILNDINSHETTVPKN